MRLHDLHNCLSRSLLLKDLYAQFEWSCGADDLLNKCGHLLLLSRFRLPSGVARWDFLLEVDGRLASTSVDSNFGVEESLFTRAEFARNFLIGASLHKQTPGIRTRCNRPLRAADVVTRVPVNWIGQREYLQFWSTEKVMPYIISTDLIRRCNVAKLWQWLSTLTHESRPNTNCRCSLSYLLALFNYKLVDSGNALK